MAAQAMSSHPAGASAGARSESTTALLGQVMLLVAAAIGFLVLGAWIGRDLSPGAAIAFSFGGLAMLFVQGLGGERFRRGGVALGWLFAVGLVLGLGLGPVLSYYASADPAAVTQAAGVTGLIVAAAGAGGFAVSKDLTGWLRPLAWAVLALVVAAIVAALLGTAGSPILSVLIGAVSAALILVDFNFLRRQGTEDDVVLLATGIFVSILNVFLSLLNLFSSE
jgi:modulator of FtsH protease